MINSVKHEQLLEGLISAEEREREGTESALQSLASRVFQEKRESLRRLDDEVRQWVWLLVTYDLFRRPRPPNDLT